MKKIDLKNLKFKPSFLKKYNYDVSEVIGVKDNERFILYTRNKLIRIYRGSLKSRALLSSYIPIEQATFYSFEIQKNQLEKIDDLYAFVEGKVYEEAGVEETEKYIIKYKIIDLLKDDKNVIIETIIVPETYLKNGYKDIVEETGYIDYISFPAFAYKTLYDEKIIKKANDLFIVFLYDKVFLTFYHEGELLSIVTISGGLNKVYESISKLKIKNFDIHVFEKLLTKKGVNYLKYSKKEEKVLETIKKEFTSLINIINSQIEKVGIKYNFSDLERIFVTSEYGNISGLQDFIQESIEIDAFGFEFYEEYNLDRLAVNPFLFLGMLEAHNAYKNQNQAYNFSIYLRKPTFFYRPSGRLFIILLASVIGSGIYPAYLYYTGLKYESKNKDLKAKLNRVIAEKNKLNAEIVKLQKKEKEVMAEREKYSKDIAYTKNFIKSIYEFKYSYIPKSSELVDITLAMNKNHVYLKNLGYDEGVFVLDVFASKDTQIPDFIDTLVKKGFNTQTDGVVFKDNKYQATIRITE